MTALRGALGFLTRAPVGRDQAAWDAFRRWPAAFPLAGYLVGAAAAVPLLLPVGAPVAAALFPAWLYLLTGVTHLDGLADLADAAAVHPASEADRRTVLRDSQVGVGGTLAVALAVVGLALAALALAALPPRVAVALVVAGEVGAKLGMAALASLGRAAHEGLGAQVTGRGPRALVPAVVVAAPAALFAPPASALAPVAAVGAAAAVATWARSWLGGTSGDVFGAANELGRLAALLAGVVAWTHW